MTISERVSFDLAVRKTPTIQFIGTKSERPIGRFGPFCVNKDALSAR
jgi:hypothetical protein